MLMAIVFGSIFVGVLAALSGFVLAQNRFEASLTGKSEGLAIAEAGLEYYRWHLAHFPTDLKNGTAASGPYSITYKDPEGSTAGNISLTITGNMSCGQLTSIDLTSKGTPTDNSGSATLFARYAEPTVAQYSYIVNDSVWAGSDRIISGPYHSNGGVRMDGTANAPVTSSLSSWTCTSDFGCSPDQSEPGVFGAGPNSNLWSYPSPQVDFAAIAANFSNLKAIAQSSGLYFARYSTGTSGRNASLGYHLVFNSNGTITVYKVTKTKGNSSVGIHNPNGNGQTDYTQIQSESLYGTYTIPSGCGLVFVEDNAWIEGAIPSKITVVAADVVDTGFTPNIMLPGAITYSNASGVSGLTAISANDILITPDAPDDLTLNGIFVAQGGAFGINLYTCGVGNNVKGTLTIHGSTISNLRTGTQWSYPGNSYGCGNGTKTAGYTTRIDSFDRKLATDPPPFTPAVSTQYEFVDWRQKQ